MQRIHYGRYPAYSHLTVKTEAQFFRTKHHFKEEILRPLPVTLIIPHPSQDNKFSYGALVKNTVNSLYYWGTSIKNNYASLISCQDFLALSASAQALYFHLDARAGESGYLTTAPEVMELVGAGEEDMRALHDGRFVLPLVDGLLMVRHPQMREYLLGLVAGEIPKPKAKKTKPAAHVRGPHGYLKLTDAEYGRLLQDIGEAELVRLIEYIDGSAKATNNKNGWKDWNLVIRTAHREGWGLRQSNPLWRLPLLCSGLLRIMGGKKTMPPAIHEVPKN